MNTVSRTLAPGVNPKLLFHVTSDLPDKIFLNGNAELPDAINEVIFDAVHLFIRESRRSII